MLPETTAFRILNNNAELNVLMDTLRGRKIDEESSVEQGIFTYSIPDNFKKEDAAPFIRINPIDEDPVIFMDDDNIAERQTIQIDFWCKNASDSAALKKEIDQIMKENNHIQYDSDRYKDPDIDLVMNVRKYRVFDFKKIN